MILWKLLVPEGMARSRTEAERLIKQGSVSVGYCKKKCSFFISGACDCGGWRKVINPTEEVEPGLAIKISSGNWRTVPKIGSSGYDQLRGIGRAI